MVNGGTITKKASGGKKSIPAGRVFFICDRIIVLFTVLYKAYFVEFGGILARKEHEQRFIYP